MKFLHNYLDDRLTAIYDKYGCFYAFSKKQFNEQMKKGEVYKQTGFGLIIPQKHYSEVLKLQNKAVNEAIQEDIKENGIITIIRRELMNREAFYTMDIDDTVGYLSTYGISYDQVKAVFDIMCMEK